jgi:phosphate/sulfate permease
VSYAVVTKILASWFVTVPVAALLSALFLVMFQGSVK